MPIDRENGTLFIHVPRTGGTKIEQSLNMTFGGDDTRVMKHKLFGYAPLGEKKIELQHLTYKQMIKSGLLTQKEFNNCFKFAFVRNPFDKLVSTYFYVGYRYFNSFESFVKFLHNKGGEPDKSPDRFSRTRDFKWFLEHPLFKAQHEFICNRNSKLMVDFLGKFEEFQKDASYVLSVLGVSEEKRDLFRRVNSTDHTHFNSYYNRETKKMVKSMYKKDFEIFSY